MKRGPYGRLLKRRLVTIVTVASLVASALVLCLVVYDYHHAHQRYHQKIRDKKDLLRQIVDTVHEQLTFLHMRFKGMDLQGFSEGIKTLPDLPSGILRDVTATDGTQKYSLLGRRDLIDADTSSMAEHTAMDAHGNLAFTKTMEGKSFTLRLSKKSLLKALEATSIDLGKAPAEHSLRVGKNLWLTMTFDKEAFWPRFWKGYGPSVCALFLVCFAMALLFSLYTLYTISRVRKENKRYVDELETVNKDLAERNQSLRVENATYGALSRALKKRHKIQAMWMTALASRRHEHLCKISEILTITMRAISGPNHVLEDGDMVRLLKEVAKSTDHVSRGVIVYEGSKVICFHTVLENIKDFLEWHLIKLNISLEISVQHDGTYVGDELALTLLLLNLIVQKLCRAYDGSVISLAVHGQGDALEVVCSCPMALEIEGKLPADLQGTPLILSKTGLEELARDLGMDWMDGGGNTRKVVARPQKKSEEIVGSNVVQMFQ